MICALLIFQSAQLPAPLADLSPWPDWLALPQDEVVRRRRGQRHRRFLKTHTPLDGLPLDRRVRYIVAARHPLDAAVSMYHQSENLKPRRLRQLTGDPQPAGRRDHGRRCGTGCCPGSTARPIHGSSRTRYPGCCTT